MTSLKEMISEEINLFENYLPSIFESRSSHHPAWSRLYESMRYSLNNGGKRFRPALALLTAKTLGHDPQAILPFAAAVEMIHTYSLIHDDLPMLDDDDERRGEPTNHKIYGEPMALLAGDALQSLAFEVASDSSSGSTPERILESSRLLARACGVDGMVGGQAIDIAVLEGADRNKDDLLLLHSMKTGALIEVSVEGAAILAGATHPQRAALKEYGLWTGLAFQLADDLLDFDPTEPERSGLPSLLGEEKTRESLMQAVDKAVMALESQGFGTSVLKSIVEFNLTRTS